MEPIKKECPKDKCFHWICPGGAAEMSGKTFKTLQEAFDKGEWKKFPEGGCSCNFGKCIRLDPQGDGDHYEPCD